jgi:hypothetical protein
MISILMRAKTLLVLLLTVAVAGCGQSVRHAATCGDAVNRMVGLAGPGDVRETMLNRCQTAKPTDQQLGCVMDADTIETAETCSPAFKLPTCDRAMAHYAGLTGESAKTDELVARCRASKPTAANLECVLNATTGNDAQVCVGFLTGPTCAAAIDHAIAIMMDSEEMRKATEEERKMAVAMIDGMKKEMVKECEEKNPRPEDLQCVMDASTPDDLERCSGFTN